MSLIFFKNVAQSVQILQIVKSININLSDYHTILDQAREGVVKVYYIISDDQKIIIIRQLSKYSQSSSSRTTWYITSFCQFKESFPRYLN